jgi:hypothetical protein
MSNELQDLSLVSNPFGPRNVRLVKTAAEANGPRNRHEDGDLHLRFVDKVEGLVILDVDRPQPPAEQRPLGITSRAATSSRLRQQVQRFLSLPH